MRKDKGLYLSMGEFQRLNEEEGWTPLTVCLSAPNKDLSSCSYLLSHTRSYIKKRETGTLWDVSLLWE